MFEFDIDKILDELDGESVKDKLQYLNDLKDQLDEAELSYEYLSNPLNY